MGHHNRHFAGDRYANAGVWGPPTSTANFCEEDYAVTLYIAEFINTLTNLAYIYFAIRYPGPRAPPAGTSPGSPPPAPSWTHPDIFSIALWVLGLLSLVFHATLKHSTQYGDELAMLVLAGALLHGSWGPGSWTAGIVAWATAAAAAALYLTTGTILHQVYAFVGMVLVAGLRTLYLILGDDRPGTTTKARRPHTTSVYLRRYAGSVFWLALAYFLWHVDLERCSVLRAYRAAMGLPWAWLLELHGWWHVLTALGASQYIRLLRELEP